MEVALLGNIINKYRVHEVAKDFGLPTKTITEILTKYATAPKNHMQVLEAGELAVIFDCLTQKYPASSIEAIFAEVYQEEKKQPAQQQGQSYQPQGGQGGRQGGGQPRQQGGQPQQRQGGRPQQGGQPRQQGQPQQGAQQPQQPAKPMSRVPEKKVVDTRKATNVNLEKYDERLQDIADRSTQGRSAMQQQGKEKFRNAGSRKRGQQTFSNKRRQEEQEKMRRLQLEIAKKAPVKVLIPDEISVGELASRMKKTAAEVVKCLMKNGVMAGVSQFIDFDTAAIIAEEMGCKVEREVVITIEEKLIDTAEEIGRASCRDRV